MLKNILANKNLIKNIKIKQFLNNKTIFKNKRTYIYSFFILIIIIIFLGLFKYNNFIYSNKNSLISSNKIEIHYIDVGQGDSILIKVNNKNILIDSGSKKSSSKLFYYLNKQHIKKINYVIATHPHEDHIGNMNKIIDKYSIENFYAPKKISNARYFKTMISSLKNKNLKINIAKSGVSLNLGPNCFGKFLAPINNEYDNTNNYSAVLQVSYKNCKFLFTGDAEKLSENEILDNYTDLKCDVLKLGHHGSSTSTSDEFLDEVCPKISIISCGKNNSYGHPSKKTLKKLKKRNIKTYRTDIDGNIIITSDGNNLYKK